MQPAVQRTICRVKDVENQSIIADAPFISYMFLKEIDLLFKQTNIREIQTYQNSHVWSQVFSHVLIKKREARVV